MARGELWMGWLPVCGLWTTAWAALLTMRLAAMRVMRSIMRGARVVREWLAWPQGPCEWLTWHGEKPGNGT